MGLLGTVDPGWMRRIREATQYLEPRGKEVQIWFLPWLYINWNTLTRSINICESWNPHLYIGESSVFHVRLRRLFKGSSVLIMQEKGRCNLSSTIFENLNSDKIRARAKEPKLWK